MGMEGGAHKPVSAKLQSKVGAGQGVHVGRFGCAFLSLHRGRAGQGRAEEGGLAHVQGIVQVQVGGAPAQALL